MDCGIQSAILSVPPGADPGSQPPLTTTVFAPPDVDQAQFEADKRSVYKWVPTVSLGGHQINVIPFRHPLFPLLALLFERCELATQSSDAQSSEAFNLDIQAFVQHQERDRKPFLANEPEIDGLVSVWWLFLGSLWWCYWFSDDKGHTGAEDTPAGAGEGAGTMQGLLQ